MLSPHAIFILLFGSKQWKPLSLQCRAACLCMCVLSQGELPAFSITNLLIFTAILILPPPSWELSCVKVNSQGTRIWDPRSCCMKKKIIKKKGNTNHTYCLFSTRNMGGYLLILFPILFPKALFGILEKEYWVKQNFAQVQYDHLCSLAQIREKQSPDFLPSLVPKHEIKTKNKNYHHGNTGFILYGYFQRHSCLSVLLLRNVSLNPGKLTVLLKK